MPSRLQLVVFVALATSACSSPTTPRAANATWVTSTDADVTYRSVVADQETVSGLKATVRSSVERVTAFVGLPYVSALEVVVYPDHAQLDTRVREIWSIPATIALDCRAVGSAARTGIYILSPRVWPSEACGLPNTPDLVMGAVAHELVHALHIQQQRAQQPAEPLFVSTRWILEGLAVYASGQSEREFAPQAPSRFAAGFAPKTFQELYDDSAFYGLAGSLVKYIDVTYGRAKLRRLITARSNADALAAVGLTESELLGAWRANVVAASNGVAANSRSQRAMLTSLPSHLAHSARE
jgi:hypothetical protein